MLKSANTKGTAMIGILVAAVMLFISACSSTTTLTEPTTGQVVTPSAASMVQEPVQPALPTNQLPGLPIDRQASDINLNCEGDDVYQQSAGAVAAAGDLVLSPGANNFDYGIYEFGAGGNAIVNADLNLTIAPGDEVWVGLSNYNAGHWEIRGPFAASPSLAINSDAYNSPGGFFYLLVLAYDGAEVTVESVQATTDGAGSSNDWPVDPVDLAWLSNWYLTLPALNSPNRVFQTAQYRDYADEVLSLVNVARAGEGLGPLEYDAHLEAIATATSKHMAVEDFFAHTNPQGMDPGDRLETTDPPIWTAWGENIAAGQPTPAVVVADWLASPGHRANIMNVNFDYIGIGIYFDGASTYGLYWTQAFGSFTTDPSTHDWIDPQEIQ